MKPLSCLAILAAAAISAPAVHADTPPARTSATTPGDKMVCKRFVRIGTLAGTTRTCKTKREWDAERAAINTPTSASGGFCGPRDTAAGMSTETC